MTKHKSKTGKKKAQTKRSSFYDSFHAAQMKKARENKQLAMQKVLQDASVEELRGFLQEADITLTDPVFQQRYKECLSIDAMHLEAMHHYGKAFTAVHPKTGLRCAELYHCLLEKLSASVCEPHLSCDPFFIWQDAKAIHDRLVSYEQAFPRGMQLVDRIHAWLKQVPHGDIAIFQHTYHFDMPAFLIGMYVHYAVTLPSLAAIQKEEARVHKLLALCPKEPEFCADMQAAILCCYGASGDKTQIETHKKQLLAQYPSEPYFVYYSLMHGLAASRHPQLVPHYYAECKQYMVYSEAEQSFKDQIALIYKAYEAYQKEQTA